MTNQVSTADDILSEYHGLETQLADPKLHNDLKATREVDERFSELQPVIQTHKELTGVQDDLEVTREMAYEGSEFTAEAERLIAEAEELKEKFTDLLAPRDPHDSDDIVVEFKSGAGDEEATFSAGELARMYQRYAEEYGLTTEVLGLSEFDLDGMKSMTISIRAKTPSRGDAWGAFKFEDSVHRVQRVPVIRSQERIQTSAAGVLVYPEPDEVEDIQIDERDLRVDAYRSSGKGGQGVNITDSAAHLTYLPTGPVVTCQKERSQIQNKARTVQILAARLQQMKEEEIAKAASNRRKSQIRNMDRSEHIRTCNFSENRASGHRIDYKAHDLGSVLGGDMDDLFKALHDARCAERLEAE